MALFRLHTLKHCEQFAEKWENVYTIQVDNAAATEAVGDAIMGWEQDVSYDTISFDGFIVYPNGTGDAVFRKLGYFGQGDLPSAGLGGILPLFNTVKVTFGNNLGRPEIKYLRLGANANNIGSGSWDGEFVTQVDEGYTQNLLGELTYVGPSGEDHTTGVTSPQVQNRQLGWHRRTRPGFKRGWVPA